MATAYDHWLFGDFDRDPEPEREPDLKPPLATRLALRRAKGRSTGGTHTFMRADTGKVVTLPTDLMDPILLLHQHRKNWQRSPYSAEQYGMYRQRVVSPVALP